MFDTQTLAIGALAKSLVFFVQAQNGSTIGPEITNMTKSNGELPNPERMQVYSVRVELINFGKADAIGLITNYAIKISLNGSPYMHAPITFCPQGGGVVGDEFNGIADARATLQFPEEFKIDWTQGTQVQVKLESGAGYTMIAAGTVRIWLDGIHTRSAVA
jgi:hypothetical protein